jgi:hypothetical protein
MLAIVWIQRRTGKSSGNDYLRCKLEVCGGPLAGTQFFSNWSCDLSKDGTVRRWQVLMESAGVSEEFELGSTAEGTADEGNRNIRRLFYGKPFKAKVKKENNGQYQNNDLEMVLYPSSWTERDHEWAREWRTEWEANSSGSAAPEDAASAPPDDDAPVEVDQFDSYDAADDDDPFNPGHI